MKRLLEKIFNQYTLVLANFLIIAASETVGHGKFFFESGLIHIIALLFILLAASRLVTRKVVTDPMLKRFITVVMVSMLAFAASHVIEFFGFVVLQSYEDSVFASVVNLYGTSMLFLILGVEALMGTITKETRRVSGFAVVGIFLFAVLTAVNFINDKAISLETDQPMPWIYCGLIFIITVVALLELRRLKRHMPHIATFTDDLTFATILILLATLPNIFYEGFEKSLGIEKMQIIYLHHFGFYAALSVMFLAFDRLNHFGGIFKDMREAETGSATAVTKRTS